MFAIKLETMRKILIPTDFSVASLQLIEYAVLNFPNTKLEIILVAGYKLPDTRWAIIHFNEREQVRKLVKDRFIIAKRRLVTEHKKNIGKLSFELFTGANSFAFQNFLDQLNVEDAIIPKEKSLYCSENKWFDTTKLIKHNVKNVIQVPLEIKEKMLQNKSSLISLFNL